MRKKVILIYKAIKISAFVHLCQWKKQIPKQCTLQASLEEVGKNPEQ